jgi:hypothetical protein
MSQDIHSTEVLPSANEIDSSINPLCPQLHDFACTDKSRRPDWKRIALGIFFLPPEIDGERLRTVALLIVTSRSSAGYRIPFSSGCDL